MKKLFLLILPFLFISTVKADTTVSILAQDFYSTNVYNDGSCTTAGYTYTNFNSFISDSNNQAIFDELYENVLDMYNTTYPSASYITSVHILSRSNTVLDLYGVVVYRKINSNVDVNNGQQNGDRYLVAYYANGTYYKNYDVDYNGFTSTVFSTSGLNPTPIGLGCASSSSYVITTSLSPFKYQSTPYYYIPNIFFESSVSQSFYPNIGYTVNIKDSNNTVLETFDSSNPATVLYPNGYVPGVNSNYTTVNLDNYEYVILNLKNYSQNNAFQTNLQLKGQIGITPVYNFGQTSKDSITGVQVQDRCNLSYSDYTTYPFYILQSDLQNNAVYYVKSCEDNSSFKFDSTVFDITYITQSNLNNPTITINGTTYNTIPYADLPSSATENEENNYIPGESGSASDTGGLDSAIKSAQSKLSEIWNTFTYFTDFVGQLFSALPSELSTVLISAFVITLVLGIIKIFVSS